MSVVYLAGLLLLLIIADHSVQGKGSTPRIKEMVVGRCYDYQYKKFGSNTTTWKNCSKIWDAFHGGFAYKNPCNLTFADFKPYFHEVGMPEIHNKVSMDFPKIDFMIIWEYQYYFEINTINKAEMYYFRVRCSILQR